MKRKESDSIIISNIHELNDLKWKKVDISSGLENFEGFIDFEEIEGVNLEIKGKRYRKDEEKEEIIKKNKGNRKKRLKSSIKAEILNKKQDTFKKDKDIEEKKDTVLFKSESINKFEEIDKTLDLPNWKDFNLSKIILKGLDDSSFFSPTEIQRRAIESIMKGNNVIAKAETGSGKTLAFGIPVIDYIIKNNISVVSSLIFSPTRELACQIAKHLESISKFSSISIITIVGGLSIQKQERLLKRIPNIIVATPGRLWEIMNQNDEFIKMLSKAKFLILDEADRLLQEGHFKELDDILNTLKRYKIQMQILVFSATFKKSLHKKINNIIHETTTSTQNKIELFQDELKSNNKFDFIDANPEESIPKKIKEGMIQCENMEKDLYLYYFLLKYPGRTIVFMNSIDHVHRIVIMLNELNIKPLSLHSKLPQKRRLQVIEKFNKNETSILIASDIAARGLDIFKIQHVIHYHLPRSMDLYIHRSGRTARAENSGVSILLYTPDETIKLKKMLFLIGKSIDEMLSFPVDHFLLKKLKPRIDLGQRITNAIRHINKQRHNCIWLKEAADDLGVNMNEFNSENDKEKNISKKDIQILRLQLKQLLSQTLYSQFSQKYLTYGLNNIAQNIIQGKTHPTFLGTTNLDALDIFKNK
ncbi:hypothetical protein T552_02463 [Pneumocystis carinii B80]|uniref:RNA helicase n=1 Tax=Pneumocystis carinii (strain B80) TaxID=1408658 RepID=A0A0W4ZF19_PNEC8|nr:hypothetical protein T552_02463 [Pneumocystis carinii B80]KTW26972.1 hypothetical protein T552_02463 [Pneumocystis carinii B80]